VEALSKAVEADRWHEGIPTSPPRCTPGNSRLAEEGELRHARRVSSQGNNWNSIRMPTWGYDP
jgi:hypothetical protein